MNCECGENSEMISTQKFPCTEEIMSAWPSWSLKGLRLGRAGAGGQTTGWICLRPGSVKEVLSVSSHALSFLFCLQPLWSYSKAELVQEITWPQKPNHLLSDHWLYMQCLLPAAMTDQTWDQMVKEDCLNRVKAPTFLLCLLNGRFTLALDGRNLSVIIQSCCLSPTDG